MKKLAACLMLLSLGLFTLGCDDAGVGTDTTPLETTHGETEPYTPPTDLGNEGGADLDSATDPADTPADTAN